MLIRYIDSVGSRVDSNFAWVVSYRNGGDDTAALVPGRVLAEQAVEDVTTIEGRGEAHAGQLIMKAREHWFQDEAE